MHNTNNAPQVYYEVLRTCKITVYGKYKPQRTHYVEAFRVCVVVTLNRRFDAVRNPVLTETFLEKISCK